MIIAAAVVNILLFGIAALGLLIIPNPTEFDYEMGIICVVLVAFNLFAVRGGMMAINRKKFTTAMISSIITIFGFLFFLGLIAIILLALSKDSFVDVPPNRYDNRYPGGGY